MIFAGAGGDEDWAANRLAAFSMLLNNADIPIEAGSMTPARIYCNSPAPINAGTSLIYKFTGR